jgi:hypothetical protein
MGQPIPKQHPAVVLRAHYKAVRALLVIATAAVIALATAVVILANDDETVTSTAQPAVQQQSLPQGTRFDGGPDEGTRGPQSYWESSEPRSSYQPAPADGTKLRAGGPQMIPQGPQ